MNREELKKKVCQQIDQRREEMVRAAKTIYVRFDLNDYSIPPEAVGRPLTLVASDTSVRILDGAVELARRSRGTPRIANRLLRRVRDFAQVEGDGTIDQRVAHDALNRLNVDERGFDEVDRKLLRTIIDKFGGGPVGLNTIAAAISEEKDAIEDIYEPFLIQEGYLRRTPQGHPARKLAAIDLVSALKALDTALGGVLAFLHI